VKVSDIVIDPEISEIFSIQDKTLEGIREQMEKIGYDKSQPVVIIKGKNILVDGHTRLAAARKAGLEEVPAVEMEFKDRDMSPLQAGYEPRPVRVTLMVEKWHWARPVPGCLSLSQSKSFHKYSIRSFITILHSSEGHYTHLKDTTLI
jgi:hypothetical protein